MNARERFLEIMKFNTAVPTLKWEFGYWGETIDNWYASGLPRRNYPALPSPADPAQTPTSHLYAPAWNSVRTGKLPSGIGVMGGGLYWPTQGFPLDRDVKDHFGMDYRQTLVNVNLLFHPLFEPRVEYEDEERYEYYDVDGVRRIFLKESATIPTSIGYPIRDWESWNRIKDERLNLKDVKGRFPKDWDKLAAEYRSRDYPLAIGGYPHGFFGTLAHLMGYEELFINYYEEPELIHDILSTFTDLWIAVAEEVFAHTDIDHVQIWEDISAGTGSMVAPELIRKFMIPCYKRYTDFMKARGVDLIFVDTDGYCFDLIPVFLEGGMTGMYPMETHCGMDIVKVRKEFPDLRIMGGISKSEVAKGREHVDKALEPVAEVLKSGGYVPFGDHFIPPDVPWEAFRYYRERLNGLIDGAAKG